MVTRSYMSRREVEQQSFGLPVAIFVPLGAILLQVLLPQAASRAGHPRSAADHHSVLRRQPSQPHRRDHDRGDHRAVAGCAHQPAHRRQRHGEVGHRLRRRQPGQPHRRRELGHARAAHLRLLPAAERAALPHRAPPARHSQLPYSVAARAAPRGGKHRGAPSRSSRCSTAPSTRSRAAVDPRRCPMRWQ